MTNNGLTLESVLESVIRITEQRSRENLELCLVSTLVELGGITYCSISRPHTRSSGIIIEVQAQAGRPAGRKAAPQFGPIGDFPLIACALADNAETAETMPDGGERRCIPIRDCDEVFALLLVESRDGLKACEAVVRGLIAIYCNYVGILKDSERDTLTGLKNRKTFDENIGRAIANTRATCPRTGDRRHREEDEHHWLGMVDIDHFKRVNDTYGHAFGDEVLLLFSALMRKVFRAEDLLFRFGGEEFVVVLAPTTADNARQAFERLRETIAGFSFPQVGAVTTSIGFVRIDPDDIPATVVGQADEALYWAKNHGRNQVRWYDDLVAAGELKPHRTEGGVELF